MSDVHGPLFDAHLHIIDPRFPLVANQGYVPDPFTVADYRERTAGLGVVGGAVVAGSFQAYDRSWIIAALQELGPGFVGVADLRADAPDQEVLALHRAGVRAVRFNLYRGGGDAPERLEEMARRVWTSRGGTWSCTSTPATSPRSSRASPRCPSCP